MKKKTGKEATINTAKTQRTADSSKPTIGIFEKAMDENAVILKGIVSDGLNPKANATVRIESAGKTIETTTNEAGAYAVYSGLAEGKVKVTIVVEDSEDIVQEFTLVKGTITNGDIKVALVPMPDEFANEAFDESFDDGTSDVFKFDKGAQITDGKLLLTKSMGNATAAVSYFSDEIAANSGVDFSFDWNAKDGGNKMGLEFRDSYGRLLFAVCSAPSKSELRTSTTGDAVDDSKAASASEPSWSAVKMSNDKTYTFRVHADFTAKTVSWQLKEKDGDVLAQKLNVPTDAVNLSKMNICSWWDSKPQYVDNFRMTVKDSETKMPLKDKKLYAFGDSIVAGHKYDKASFVNFVSSKEGMDLSKYAVNGATIMDIKSEK